MSYLLKYYKGNIFINVSAGGSSVRTQQKKGDFLEFQETFEMFVFSFFLNCILFYLH